MIDDDILDDDDVLELGAHEADLLDDDILDEDILDAPEHDSRDDAPVAEGRACGWLERPTQVDGAGDETIVDAARSGVERHRAGTRGYPPGIGARELEALISRLTAELCDEPWW